MNYIVNLFSIFSSTSELLIEHDRALYAELLVGGLVLGLGLWVFAVFFGRLFYKPYQLTVGQHVLCGFLAILLAPTIPIYASATYLKPGLAATISNWRDTLAHSKTWNDQQFKRQYYEIKKMGIEDFTNHPTPEQGGNVIPATKYETRVKCSQIVSEGAIENFNFNFPLLSTVMGATPAVSTDKVNQDVNAYFNLHPGSTYPIDRGVQLVANQISIELESQIPRTILLIRISLIIKIIFWYGICFSWIAYASLKKIKIHSSHSISAQG
jgi:hypothetical protein